MDHPQEAIHAHGRFSGSAGLHRIGALLQALDNPHKRLRFVHLAGTNGKGSTAAMTAQILQEAGYRVGLFTSPYLVRFHERMRINGVPISEQALARLTQQVIDAEAGIVLPQGESIGEFECITAIGMLYFVEQQCDIVVLETGLGGAFDATNAIDAPLVAAITAISLDHTAVLGNHIEEIAQAKAGIIKRGSAVVCADAQPYEAQRVIAQVCAVHGITPVVPRQVQVIESTLKSSTFCYDGQTYTLAMAGAHQVQNACVAIEIARQLAHKGMQIVTRHIQEGLANVRFAGRFECVADKPLTFVDGAHNPAGIAALCALLKAQLHEKRMLLVLGMVADKAVEECVWQLAPYATQIFVCAPQNERALASETLTAMLQSKHGAVSDCQTLTQALTAARLKARENDCILITGSLYLVGEAEKIFMA